MNNPSGAVVWIERDGVIQLQLDGSRCAVDANDVFSAEFEGRASVRGQRVHRPSDDLSVLEFSRFPGTVALRLRLDAASADRPYVLEEVVRLPRGTETLVSPHLATDHLVVGAEWYPIDRISFDSVSSALRELDLPVPAHLSLAQYLRVHEVAGQSGIVEDTTGEGLTASTWATSLAPVSIEGLAAELYPYQVQGLAWLAAMTSQGLGSVLADEMGLGKTLQIIGLLTREISEARRPNLVVAPPSLLENWRREIARFAPAVVPLVHAGPRRTGFPRVLAGQSLVLVSYETIRTDAGLLGQVAWNIVVLDEAQAIKNPDALRTAAAKALPRNCGIAVTGTPLQNSLLDLWSIVDFCVPGLLGESAPFRGDAGLDENLGVQTERFVSPLMLRRLVTEVGQDLPPRVDIPEVLLMGDREAADYEQMRQEGSGNGLALLQRLRMYCTHPRLATADGTGVSGPADDSVKYERLVEILSEVVANGERALVFTSFINMIDAAVADLPARLGCRVAGIDGRVPTPVRQDLVDALNAGRLDVLVLNPQVGGTGLNITGANHVIHFNLEWNPASIDQASARAHRRGQDKTVFVHYLVYAGTVEEVIEERLARKRELASVAVRGTDGDALETADLARALAMSPLTHLKGEG